MILVLSGSSSCGKNTIIKQLMEEDKNLEYIHTFTSRDKRPGEKDGEPYYFITKEEFQQKIKNGDFFEHELIHNNFYGVEKNLCKELLKQNKHLLKDMGVIGTFNLKEQLSDSFVETVYLYVSKSELKRRLKKRGDSRAQIKLRLKRFKFEKSYLKKYNFVINNNNKQNTTKILQQILKNNAEYSNYISVARNLNRIDKKKFQIYKDDLINNKVFKPIKVMFDGENFYIKNHVELYLASIKTGKNLAKIIIKTNKKFNGNKNADKVKEFVQKLD